MSKVKSINISIHPQMRKDPFYRYKRPVTQINHKVLKGTTVTMITNIDSIETSLFVTSGTILKRIKKKFGCKVKDDIIFKVLEVSDIEKVIDSFVLKYISCVKCKCPELKQEDGKTFCKACGANQKGGKDKESDCKEDDEEDVQIDDDIIFECEKDGLI